MKLLRLRYTDRFQKAFDRLEGVQKRRVLISLEKLMAAPQRRGLNLEKLRGFDDLYTVRVDRGMRILLRQELDENGELYALLSVGPHDAVYRL